MRGCGRRSVGNHLFGEEIFRKVPGSGSGSGSGSGWGSDLLELMLTRVDKTIFPR